MDDDLYVLVAERDTHKPEDGGRPIVWEQYLDQGAATFDRVSALQRSLGDRYGHTRIAKLVFLDTPPRPWLAEILNPKPSGEYK